MPIALKEFAFTLKLPDGFTTIVDPFTDNIQIVYQDAVGGVVTRKEIDDNLGQVKADKIVQVIQGFSE